MPVCLHVCVRVLSLFMACYIIPTQTDRQTDRRTGKQTDNRKLTRAWGQATQGSQAPECFENGNSLIDAQRFETSNSCSNLDLISHVEWLHNTDDNLPPSFTRCTASESVSCLGLEHLSVVHITESSPRVCFNCLMFPFWPLTICRQALMGDLNYYNRYCRGKRRAY